MEIAVQGLVERMDALEVKVAYQENVIEELNKVIVEQWDKVDHVLRQMKRLEERLRDVQESAGREPQDEPPPPHY